MRVCYTADYYVVVLEEVRRRGIALVVVLAGGYAGSASATADLHAMVHREANVVFT